MTAQVAILNRSAVALASDSAVTIRGDKLNIYQTVNKLFAVSKYEPVGIMVYGGAELMGVPWESSIKLFRKALGTKRCKRLIDYSDAFVEFLESNRILFPSSMQDHVDQYQSRMLSDAVAEAVIAMAKEKIESGETISDEETVAAGEDVIDALFVAWSNHPRLDCFAEADEAKLLQRYGPLIEEVTKDVLGQLSLPASALDMLWRAIVMTFTRNRFLSSTGIVLAGFGEEEVFPAIDELLIEFVVGDRLKFRRSTRSVAERGAMIVPLAQRKMVDAFLQGIHPDYGSFLDSYLQKVFGEYHAGLTEGIDGITDSVKTDIAVRIESAGKALLEDLHRAREVYSREKHVAAKVDTIQVLPKQELAEMAEALVNLTSFEQRLSGSAETVGGQSTSL